MGRTGTRQQLRFKRPVVLAAVFAVIVLVVLIALKAGGMGRKTQVDRAGALGVVCIDPGHGGTDQGTSWEGRLEKDDNLTAALALGQALGERGIYAVYTRDADDTLTLEERVACAQNEGADFFVSLHRNYAEQSACGVEIWVAQQCSTVAEDLARATMDQLSAAGIQNDRGVRRGSQSGESDYYVLAHTSMPAMLIELGFIQDEEDNRLFDSCLEDYADAIADAVAAQLEKGTN